MPTPTHFSRSKTALELADGWLQVVSTHDHSPREDVHAGERDHDLDLVLFDMDGTLTTGLSSWELVHHAFGVNNHSNWHRYAAGEITDLEFMRSDIELWTLDGRKVHVEDVERILAATRLMPHAKDLVDELRKRRIATCILSGGLDLVARNVCLQLGIDMYVANGLQLDPEGFLAGEGLCFVEVKDKGKVAREILTTLGVAPERAAAVGNSMWDVPMFRAVGRAVAMAPVDDAVRAAAHGIVEGTDMRGVLPHLLRPRVRNA